MFMSKRCSEEDDESGDLTKIISKSAELIGTFNLSDHIWFFKNLDLQGLRKSSKDIHRRFDALMERVMREVEDRKNKGFSQNFT
ncbi:putative cytochrome P450 superfamily [Helianthus anomalus]